MLDMGGVVPGGFAGTKKDVFENGLVIAPQLLYRATSRSSRPGR